MASELQKIIRQSWADTTTPIGDQFMVMSLDEASHALAVSGFMVNWLAGKIREALIEGVTFQYTKRVTDAGWKGREDGVVAEYRLAKPGEAKEFITYTDNHGATRVKKKRGSMYEPEETPEMSPKEMAIAILKAMPRGKQISSKRIAQVTTLERDVVKGLLKKLKGAGKVTLVEGKWVRPLKPE